MRKICSDDTIEGEQLATVISKDMDEGSGGTRLPFRSSHHSSMHCLFVLSSLGLCGETRYVEATTMSWSVEDGKLRLDNNNVFHQDLAE
jgi:hypothetical protein